MLTLIVVGGTTRNGWEKRFEEAVLLANLKYGILNGFSMIQWIGLIKVGRQIL